MYRRQRRESLISFLRRVKLISYTPIQSSSSKLLLLARSQDISIEKINELLNEGAEINAEDYLNNSVLHHAVLNPNISVKIVKFLLETGANPDARNRKNRPPIVCCHDLSIAQLLIKYTVMYRMISNTLKKYALNDPLSEIELESTSFSHKVRKESNLSIYDDVCERNYIAAFRDFCIVELKMMKKDKITPNITFFNFITEHCLKSSQTFENFDESCITKILLRIYNNKYPYYQDLIYTAIRHSNFKVRASMFDLQMYMVDPVTDFTKRTIFLNAECISKIEDYLSNEDIVNLILAFAQNSKLRKKLNLIRHTKESEENEKH